MCAPLTRNLATLPWHIMKNSPFINTLSRLNGSGKLLVTTTECFLSRDEAGVSRAAHILLHNRRICHSNTIDWYLVIAVIKVDYFTYQ